MRTSTRILINGLILPALLVAQRPMFFGMNKPSASAPKQSFGFYFRSSALTSSPSPPAGYEFGTYSINYPTTTTINGFSVTYGLVTTGSSTAGCPVPQTGFGNGAYDGATTVPRVSGALYAKPSNCFVWRIDLPAGGSYTFSLGFGWDLQGATVSAAIYDGASNLFTVASGTAIAAGEYIDATGVTRANAAAWVAAGTNGGAPKTITFSGTTLYLAVGSSGVADYTPLASMYIIQN